MAAFVYAACSHQLKPKEAMMNKNVSLERTLDLLCERNPSLVDLRRQINEVVQSLPCIVCGNSLVGDARFCSDACASEYDDANANVPDGWPFK